MAEPGAGPAAQVAIGAIAAFSGEPGRGVGTEVGTDPGRDVRSDIGGIGTSAIGADPAISTLAATRRLIWLLVVPVLALLGVLTALQYWQHLREAESALSSAADDHAQDLATLARPAIDHVHDLQAMLESDWLAPPDAGPDLRQALSQRQVDGKPDGWTLDDAPEAARRRFGQVLWTEADGPPPDIWLRRARAFVDQARIVHLRAPGFEASWFLAYNAPMSMGYPWQPISKVLETYGERRLVALNPLRAVGAAEERAWLDKHPGVTSQWGPANVTDLGGHLIVEHSALVVVGGELQGDVILDYRIDELQRRVVEWAGGTAATGRTWIVDERGRVLADSLQPLSAGGQKAGAAIDVRLADRLPAGLPPTAMKSALAQPGVIVHEGGWAMLAAGRPGLPWTFVQAVPQSTLAARILPSLLPNGVIALALLAMFVGGQWALSRNFVDPALRVLAYLRGRSLDDSVSAPSLGKRWQPWLDAVTETFRLQRELQRRERQREAFKSAIVDHALAAIVATDESDAIVEFNPAAETMFGFKRADVLGRPAGEVLLPARFRGAYGSLRTGMAASGDGLVLGKRLESVSWRADGTEFPIECLLWRTEVAGAVFYTASCWDLTERRNAEGEIERQRDALRQSDKLSAMGGLLAGVAHELNNPLAIAMGRAAMLEEELDNPALRADARRIRDAAERCGRIVRTFLNMARSRPPRRGPVALNDLVRAAAEMLAYTYRSHGIELQLALDDNLPSVQADGDQVGQVVLNLLVNAQQALDGAADGSAAGQGAVVRLYTGVEAGGDSACVVLRVSDNGPGVPPALADRIFDSFFTTKPEGMGTGMGLPVSRQMARDHGGDLVLEPSSALGGASFCLRLPIAPSGDVGDAGQVLSDRTPVGAIADESPASHARLLVVDDEPELGELMRSLLEGAGHEVATAESGAVALELLDTARFDLIVCDMRMPDMTGAALWQRVRESHPALARRMLFVSGDTLAVDAREFFERSGCGMLDKPFTKADLLARVAELLDTAEPSA